MGQPQKGQVLHARVRSTCIPSGPSPSSLTSLPRGGSAKNGSGKMWGKFFKSFHRHRTPRASCKGTGTTKGLAPQGARTVCACQPAAFIISINVAPLAHFISRLLRPCCWCVPCPWQAPSLLRPASSLFGLPGCFTPGLRGLGFRCGVSLDCFADHWSLRGRVAVVTSITQLRRNCNENLWRSGRRVEAKRRIRPIGGGGAFFIRATKCGSRSFRQEVRLLGSDCEQAFARYPTLSTASCMATSQDR